MQTVVKVLIGKSVHSVNVLATGSYFQLYRERILWLLTYTYKTDSQAHISESFEITGKTRQKMYKYFVIIALSNRTNVHYMSKSIQTPLSEFSYFKLRPSLTQAFNCTYTSLQKSIANRTGCSGSAIHKPKVTMPNAKRQLEGAKSLSTVFSGVMKNHPSLLVTASSLAK